ncbi:MAG TPA: hypothetical protein VLI39_11105, partial [Sedimentisphaerales bacterium]|nr:hypothetical protein [Sedimentisphaerales bacterium]
MERNLLLGNKEGFSFREQTRSTPRIDDRKAEPVLNHLEEAPVKGGAKVRRVADQNCGTPALCTPCDPGCQLFPIHFFNPSSGPGSSA